RGRHVAGAWGAGAPGKRRVRRGSAAAGGRPSASDEVPAEEAPGSVLVTDRLEVPAPEGRGGTDLNARIGTASLAFRGYDVANLGRSPELLAHPSYGPVVRRFLDDASAVAADALKRPFDLAARVESGRESDLGTFAEDIALIVAMELAQLALLEEFFGVSVKGARQSFGYSIGEMGALVSGGVFTMEELLPIPLGCADDCAELAADTTLGVVFSRGATIPLKDVQELCTEVSSEGRGMVGVSSYLSPNTLLVIGQGDTLDRLDKARPRRPPDR